MGDGLANVHHTEKTFVEIPVSNTIKHDVILASRTVLGSVQAVNRIVETIPKRASEQC